MLKIAIVGGNGRVGRLVVARLAKRGDLEIVALGRKQRSPESLPRNVSFVNTTSIDLAAALSDATHIVNCASLKLNSAIYKGHSNRLQRVVLIGSTRSYTAFDDPHAMWIRDAEQEFDRSGLPGVMLQPSLVYGGGDKNITQVAYYLAKTPIVPLPDGGHSLIQPVHYEDVALSIEAALFAPGAPGKPIIVAGPRAITIREMIETVATAMSRKVRVVPLPSRFLHIAAAITRQVPWVPSISKYQVDRMLEDRSFDISEMRARLQVHPREFVIDDTVLAGVPK